MPKQKTAKRRVKPETAIAILMDGRAHERPLTEKQQQFFAKQLTNGGKRKILNSSRDV